MWWLSAALWLGVAWGATKQDKVDDKPEEVKSIQVCTGSRETAMWCHMIY